jgi:PAS domain S-box-containing protein
VWPLEFDRHEKNVGRFQAKPIWQRRVGRLMILLKSRIARAILGVQWHDVATAEAAGIEHLKDARWQLADSETRFRELLDSQNELIVRRGADGVITFANRAFRDAFGVESDDVRGRRFSPEVFAIDAAGPERIQRPNAIEQLQTSKGLRWIQWEEHRLSSVQGGIEIQRVGRDVTDERRREAELREARDQADAANRAKSRFLAAMSHEIRTPMNGIIGMASLLRETVQTDEQLSYMRAIDQSAKSLLALIDEILDFSKIEAGKLQLIEAPFSLRACVHSAIELLAPKAGSRGNKISCRIAPDVDAIVGGDAERVRQILLNLLSNAVKFTENGEIDVAVRRLPAEADSSGALYYEIVVRDSGVGFSADTMKVLFDEFEQADNVLGGRQSGTGLGLAISKRLARAMGGDIWADGELGKGATFGVVLKLAEATKATGAVVDNASCEQSAQMHMVCSAGHAPRVLIVEDNDINALMTRRMCERFGCTVVAVKDGQEAVDAVMQSLEADGLRFDIVLMDVFMPRMGGLEATHSIKESIASMCLPASACPPIIALTANAFAEDRDRCLGVGMDDYLAKPFDAGQLRALLARWLTLSALRRAS